MRERSSIGYSLARWIVLSSCLALSACVPLEEQHSEAGTAAPPNVVATAQQGSAQTVQQMPVNFFLAQEQPAEGLSALETANGTIWLSPQAVFTQADLRTVEPRRWDGSQQAFVRFGFVAQATQTLADLSKRYAGKILVITVGRDI